MDEEKAAVPAAHESDHDALPSLSRKEEAADLDAKATSVRSDQTQHLGDDLENHNDMGHQLSNTTGGSVWSSEQMSLPQEILFVATVCLTQFCNREFPKNQLRPPEQAPSPYCPLPPEESNASSRNEPAEY